MTEAEIAGRAEALVTELDAAGLQDSSLDEMVHDTASSHASSVNNEGMAGQIFYLLTHGWSEQEIKIRLKV